MRFKNFKKFILLIILFFFISFGANGQHFLSTKGKAIVNENQDTIILRGIGLGGWMVKEGYMMQTSGFADAQYQIMDAIEDLIGEQNTDTFNDMWLLNHVRKTDIDSLKSWGFNSVRVPMHYNLFTLPIEEEPIKGFQTWLTSGFELLDSLIGWCEEKEIYVILDLHAAPGGQGKDAAISDYDPSKPSLWESKDNRDKMVALWKKIAERYADYQWVAGYDLLNETNWDLPGGVAIKNLYKEITDSIRKVDNKHIIFIEGNWFANDFTGLTPPWDINLVYSPHKYWSFNDQSSIGSFLEIKNKYNVPLYLGETGENSNEWFQSAVKLYEDNDIGWAWWPLKKIESVVGPISITKSKGYQILLDYWNNGGSKPSVEFSKNVLFQLTEDLKIENCLYQKDVIDALFRQPYTDKTIPFSKHSLPGKVFASDYDLGKAGEAYGDFDIANYSVSTGEYSAWNNGWAYRNDGVDIEKCDDLSSNGFSIGYLNDDEWIQYEVDIKSDGVYDLNVRTSSGGSGGRMYFTMDNQSITESIFVYPTGGWQKWSTTTITDIILPKGIHKLRFYVDRAGFNINSFEFIKSSKSINDVITKYLTAETSDEYNIQMFVNKDLSYVDEINLNDFQISVNGSKVPIQSIFIDPNNSKIFNFSLNQTLIYSDIIKISYTGDQLQATDGSNIEKFSLKNVRNTLNFVYQLPTKIESEDYTFQKGVELEETTDVGGGLNIAYLDPNDFLDYEISVTSSGEYQINYRTAAQFGTGSLKLQFIDTAGVLTEISNPTFLSTGDWQNWKTTSETVQLDVGRYTMRILITQSPFNLNWLEFKAKSLFTKDKNSQFNSFSLFPNPCSNLFNIQFATDRIQDINLSIYDFKGKTVSSKSYLKTSSLNEQISLKDYPSGIYLVKLRLDNGSVSTKRIIKAKK
jgi:hypothetical protein